MANDNEPEDRPPLLTLSRGQRNAIALLLVALAIVHLLVPSLSIDAVFIGLLAGAGFVALFDVESIDILGIRARRRIIEAQEALARAPVPVQEALPQGVPDVSKPAPAPVNSLPFPGEPPVVRLLDAVERVRVEMAVLAGNAGRIPRGPIVALPIPALVSALRAQEVLSPELASAIDTASRVRNIAAHGGGSMPNTAPVAADLAETALRLLQEIPTNYVRVVATSVPLFRDEALTEPHDAGTGTLLQSFDRSGKELAEHIFPTSREYRVGQYVTWEWDMTRVFRHDAWCVHPVSQKRTHAFSQSATFDGRAYPEEWGVQPSGRDA